VKKVDGEKRKEIKNIDFVDFFFFILY